MTIASFCRDQLLAHGPLSLDDLVTRAVPAGVTKALNPHASLLTVLRQHEIQLVDDRWVTALWLLEGRCLTARELPELWTYYSRHDPDLGLLVDAPLLSLAHEAGPPGPGELFCLGIETGTFRISTIKAPDTDTLEVAALAERIQALTPQTGRYGDLRGPALRAVAQLMVDDPSTFRTPLPPLSTWVPALVEDARRRDEKERQMLEWHEAEERRRLSQVVLDDCTAIEVELAAARAGSSVRDWVLAAIDRALAAQPRSTGTDGVVIDLRERWR